MGGNYTAGGFKTPHVTRKWSFT